MSYTPTTWADGDLITAQKLNNIENGIANLENDLINFNNLNINIQNKITLQAATLGFYPELTPPENGLTILYVTSKSFEANGLIFIDSTDNIQYVNITSNELQVVKGQNNLGIGLNNRFTSNLDEDTLEDIENHKINIIGIIFNKINNLT